MNTREEYVAKLKSQLDSWNAQMDRWEAQAKSAQQSAKARYEQELADLRAKRESARYNLKQIENASASAWDDLRKGADEAWERMSAAIRSAGSHFDSK